MFLNDWRAQQIVKLNNDTYQSSRGPSEGTEKAIDLGVASPQYFDQYYLKATDCQLLKEFQEVYFMVPECSNVISASQIAFFVGMNE